MTDEIKKMLEPSADFFDPQKVSRESFDRLKRGFLKLMEQRNYWRYAAIGNTEDTGLGVTNADLDAELEAAMKGGVMSKFTPWTKKQTEQWAIGGRCDVRIN